MINSRKIKARMVEHGATQKNIGEVLGIASASANQKLNNKRSMTIEEAIKIADFLEIDPYDFKAYFLMK